MFCSRRCDLDAHHAREKADGRKAAMRARQRADPRHQAWRAKYMAEWRPANRADQQAKNRARKAADRAAGIGIVPPAVKAARAKRRAARARLARAARGRSARWVWVAGPCQLCGEPFVCRSPSGFASYCGPCGRRRGKKKWARQSTFVFARDNHLCHLCWLPADPTQVVPHPDAPTLDHVVPRSRGGSDDPSNLRCAHFRCNCLRGDQLLDEWRRVQAA